jgi:uncharacterized protein
VKIAVISDTHGNIEPCINILKDIDNIDLIIHLGDNTNDAKDIADILQIETIAVKGNCDFYDNSSPDEKIIDVDNKKIFITHGHKYRVKSDLNSIYYRGKEINADIVLFGHSHNPILVKYDDILFMNPGSGSLPRAGSKKSIGLIEINDMVDAQILKLK